MMSIERRVAALERSSNDDSPKIVVVEDGETQADALKRLGLPPDARGVVWCTTLDVLL